MSIHAFGLARIGRDAEVRTTPQGETVCNLSLAFSYGRKDSDGKKPTTWIDASLWGKRAEAMAPYLLRGTSVEVLVEDVAIQSFTKSDGVSGSKLVGRVASIDFAGPPPERAAAAPPPPPPKPKPVAAPANGGFDDMDDSIPF